jgi:hypothetical protein
MWADTLLLLERGHLLRLLVWGVASVVCGTLLLTYLAWKRDTAPLLRHFGLQTVAWGAVIVVICLVGWRGLELRDFAGLQRLLNVLWLNVGLNGGYVGVGTTIALLGWKLGKRAGLVGAGLGVIVQGLALLLLDIRLISAIGPLR